MTDRRTTRTWAEIDLDALAHNYRLLRGQAPEARFLGLVKANAYGHGAVPVAKKLEALGADMLAVACLDEAIELRQAGIVIPILCLGQTPPELAPELLEYDITQTVGDLETGAALSAAAVAAGKTLTIHVKVDTGMGRLGFVYYEDDDEAALERAGKEIESLCALPGLEPEGIFTHFANADGS
ncbi:MAG: alanine racemase, partial [Lawsonibacter sp.]|nr:alanine racemase [Lawsonibacter sp.]